MKYLLYFFQLILIKYTSAQVISLGGRNFLSNQNCGNIPIATNFANNAGLLANIGQTGQLANSIITQNNLGQEYVTSSLISNSNYGQEYFTPNVISNANANSNIGLASGNIGLAGGNIGLASGNIGLASGNIGLGNIGNEIVAYKNIPMYANVVKPPREYGIEFSSGALSVGGNVEVNGRMPFNANVELQGVVPAQGQGAVEYKCDQLGAEDN